MRTTITAPGTGRAASGGGALARLYARLSRVTTSGEFIPEVDGLRFLAIAPVVVFHLRNHLLANPVTTYSATAEADWAARLTHHWHYGVQLFFIISGFVLALPFARARLQGGKPVGLRAYFLRRLTRLEPPYVLVMLGLFVLLILVKGLSASALWPHLAAGLTYTHGLVYAAPNPVNIVAWSLEIEVQFYVVMPLLASVFAVRGAGRRRAAVVALAAAAVLFQWAFVAYGGRLHWSLLNYLQYFLAGFLLADLYLCGWLGRARGFGWDLAAAAALPLMLLVAERPQLARAAFAPLALVLFCAAFRGRVANTFFTRRPVTVVGGMCYTIYLVHAPLMSAFEKAVGPVSLTPHFVVNLLLHGLLFAPVLLLCSAAFFLLVEKPCMRRDWPRRLWRRARAWGGRRAPAEGLAVGGSLAD